MIAETDPFIRLLANLPPQQWAESRRRLAVANRYRQLSSPTLADADAAAEELGVNQASFYRIMAAYNWSKGAANARPKATSGPSLHPLAETHLQKVLAEAPPAARPVDLHWEVVRRCEADGVPPPSRVTVSTRMRRAPAGANLPSVLRRKFDLILDAAPLDLTTSVNGKAQVAALMVLLDKRGSAIAHRLSDWPLGPTEAAALLSGLDGPLSRRRMSLLCSKAIPPFAADTLEHLVQLRIDPSAPLSNLDGGSAVKAAFGDRIGRIGMLSGGKPNPKTRSHPVAREDAIAVLALLVAEHNAP